MLSYYGIFISLINLYSIIPSLKRFNASPFPKAIFTCFPSNLNLAYWVFQGEVSGFREGYFANTSA
jgi:hypothetical protein